MSRTNIRQIEAFNAVMKGGSITKGCGGAAMRELGEAGIAFAVSKTRAYTH